MKHRTYGFTIVELLIVIVVVGILAGITYVGYNGIQKRATESVIKSDLAQAAKAIETHSLRREKGQYGASAPTVLPDSLKNSTDRPFRYFQRDGGGGYCADMGSSRNEDVSFYVDSTNDEPKTGVCPESIVAEPMPIFCFGYNIHSSVSSIHSYFGVNGGYSTGPGDPACSLDVVIPDQIGNRPMYEIQYFAFGYASLTSVTLPDTLNVIGQYAFYGNSISSVTIPSSVYFIDSNAFADNPGIVCRIPNSYTISTASIGCAVVQRY